VASVRIAVEHELVEIEAHRRLSEFMKEMAEARKISDLQERLSPNRSDYRFTIHGIPVKGSIHIFPEAVVVLGELPAAGIPFKGSIERAIRSMVTHALAN
jgi:Putative polyhydroxyalkanoic acid system protein (PHA_gran_rgn)